MRGRLYSGSALHIYLFLHTYGVFLCHLWFLEAQLAWSCPNFPDPPPKRTRAILPFFRTFDPLNHVPRNAACGHCLQLCYPSSRNRFAAFINPDVVDLGGARNWRENWKDAIPVCRWCLRKGWLKLCDWHGRFSRKSYCRFCDRIGRSVEPCI